jgi:hypothetical protein
MYHQLMILCSKKELKLADTTCLKKRRSFFWADEDQCSGAQCLVSWDKVCTAKQFGGLGLKNLRVQNICLLLNLCFKTLYATQTPWKLWIHSQLATASIAHSLAKIFSSTWTPCEQSPNVLSETDSPLSFS